LVDAPGQSHEPTVAPGVGPVALVSPDCVPTRDPLAEANARRVRESRA
jgi:hypothetical protein